MENNSIIELDSNGITNLDSEFEKEQFNKDKEINSLKKKLKSSKKKNALLLVLLSLFLIFFIGISIVYYIVYYNIRPHFRAIFDKGFNLASISQISKNNALDLETFTTKLAFIDDLVNILYYYDKDNDKIQDEMFKGYVKALGDKYADYLSKEEFEDFTSKKTEGVYYGIGCVVEQNRKNNDCIVSNIYENSPAEKAGIKVGDIFVSVDGEYVRGKPINDLVEKIRGEEGAERKIVVFRQSENKDIELIAYCGKVDIKLISSKIYENNIGYLKIDEFTGKVSNQFKKEIDSLLSKNIKGLIIDCRNNPGGELITVCEMMDYLVKDRDGRYTLNQKEEVFDTGKSLLVYIKERDKIVDAFYGTDNHSVELPMVVLTDTQTASAAELFTECLRDYKKATVVGVRTYGKGVVQNIIPYDDGSAIKFTVSEYFPPSGYSIDKVGILPDYSLDISGDEVVYDENHNIVVIEDGVKYVIDSTGAIIEERKIATESNANIEVHTENLKIYDDNNSFLTEDWYLHLDEKYDDKILLQALVVLRDKIK